MPMSEPENGEKNRKELTQLMKKPTLQHKKRQFKDEQDMQTGPRVTVKTSRLDCLLSTWLAQGLSIWPTS